MGEAITDDQRRPAHLLSRLAQHGRAIGILVHGTLINAAHAQGLAAEPLARAFTLPLADGSLPVLRTGLERFLVHDYVSAVYVLARLLEEAFRRVLAANGFDTTVFRRLDSAIGASRTDDAALGDLLRLRRPDGMTAADRWVRSWSNRCGPRCRCKSGRICETRLATARRALVIARPPTPACLSTSSRVSLVLHRPLPVGRPRTLPNTCSTRKPRPSLTRSIRGLVLLARSCLARRAPRAQDRAGRRPRACNDYLRTLTAVHVGTASH